MEGKTTPEELKQLFRKVEYEGKRAALHLFKEPSFCSAIVSSSVPLLQNFLEDCLLETACSSTLEDLLLCSPAVDVLLKMVECSSDHTFHQKVWKLAYNFYDKTRGEAKKFETEDKEEFEWVENRRKLEDHKKCVTRRKSASKGSPAKKVPSRTPKTDTSYFTSKYTVPISDAQRVKQICRLWEATEDQVSRDDFRRSLLELLCMLRKDWVGATWRMIRLREESRRRAGEQGFKDKRRKLLEDLFQRRADYARRQFLTSIRQGVGIVDFDPALKQPIVSVMWVAIVLREQVCSETGLVIVQLRISAEPGSPFYCFREFSSTLRHKARGMAEAYRTRCWEILTRRKQDNPHGNHLKDLHFDVEKAERNASKEQKKHEKPTANRASEIMFKILGDGLASAEAQTAEEEPPHEDEEERIACHINKEADNIAEGPQQWKVIFDCDVEEDGVIKKAVAKQVEKLKSGCWNDASSAKLKDVIGQEKPVVPIYGFAALVFAIVNHNKQRKEIRKLNNKMKDYSKEHLEWCTARARDRDNNVWPKMFPNHNMCG